MLLICPYHSIENGLTLTTIVLLVYQIFNAPTTATKKYISPISILKNQKGIRLQKGKKNKKTPAVAYRSINLSFLTSYLILQSASPRF